MWKVAINYHAERIAKMSPAPALGRNPREGYLRGCGIQFGNISAFCADDPVFAEAFAAARPRTTVPRDRLENIFVLMKFYFAGLLPGHVVEFGSYRGGSAIFMAIVARRLHPGMQVYALDTFAGMPETDPVRDVVVQGDFVPDFDELRRTVAELGLDNLHLVKGLFSETARPTLAAAGPIRLAHIDCDTYEGIAESYPAVKPAMVAGGYIVFDDPLVSACLGAFEAVERLVVREDGLHAEQTFPHLVYRYKPLG